MKKLTAFALFLTLVAALAGCGSTEKKSETLSTVTVDYAGEELLADPDGYYEFIADDTQYQTKVVFSTDGEVTDFKVVTIEMYEVPDSDDIGFNITDELYRLDKLTADRPLVVGMEFVGTIPNMGISYTDEQGTVKTYSINMSGKDGSVLLVEI